MTKIRAASLAHYEEVARHTQLDASTMLRRFGLSQALIANTDYRVPSSVVVGLLEASAKESSTDSFGLQMAELRSLSDFGAVSLLLTHQATLRTALLALNQYQHLLNEAIGVFIEDIGSTTIIRGEVVTDTPMPSRQAYELAIGVVFRMSRALLGANWRPSSVNFTHPAPQDMQVHRRVFRCPLIFDSDFNGIVCAAADLDLVNPHADPAMGRYAQQFIETLPGSGSLSLVQEVRKSIYLLLPMGRATVEQIAESQGMNVRLLQRRLDAEGETFSNLMNTVRRELVLRYIENHRYSLGRIAEQLGYSKPSAFTRWFSAQFGMSPAAWRMNKSRATSE